MIKKIIKRNILFILVSVTLFYTATYRTFEFWNGMSALRVEFYEEALAKCEQGEITIKGVCQNVIYVNETYDTFLPDAITAFHIVVTTTEFSIFQLSYPLFIILISVFAISKEYKSIYPKMYLQRGKYKDYLISVFKRSYKYVLIYPVMYLYVFFICYIMSGHFDYQLSIDIGYEIVSKNAVTYLLCFFSNIILQNSIYISLGLIYVKKFSNSILASIVGYLTFLGIEVFNEGVLDYLILYKQFNLNFPQYVNIMDVVDLSDRNVVFSGVLVLYSLILFIIMLLSYKNKEKFIMNLEKNK